MKYKLLQIKDVELCPYAFSSCSFAGKHGFSLDDYKVVYEGELEDYPIKYALEKLFEMFNCAHPEDFEGRSMSVSDVVEINGKYYYTDTFGFNEVV